MALMFLAVSTAMFVWCFLGVQRLSDAQQTAPAVLKWDPSSGTYEYQLEPKIREIIRAEYAVYQSELSRMLTFMGTFLAVMSIGAPIMSYTFVQREHVQELKKQLDIAEKNADAAQAATEAAQAAAEKLIADADQQFKQALESQKQEYIQLREGITNQWQDLSNAIAQIQARQDRPAPADASEERIPEPERATAITIRPISDSNVDRADALYKLATMTMVPRDQRTLINEAIELNPNNAMFYVFKGKNAFKNGFDIRIYDDKDYIKNYFGKIIDVFNKAEKLGSTDGDMYFYRAMSYWNIGQYDNALSDFINAKKITSLNAFDKDIGKCLYKLKRYPEALEYANQVVEYDDLWVFSPYEFRADVYEAMAEEENDPSQAAKYRELAEADRKKAEELKKQISPNFRAN